LFPKLLGNFDLLNIFQVVLEGFPSSFGNFSCIEIAFGTV
jgi:hypothetical protein